MSVVCRLAVFCIILGELSLGFAQAPLPVNGVTDRQVATGSVSFQVPVSAGHTYGAWLDGQRIPAGLDILVTNADYHELAVFRTNLATGSVTNRLVRFIVKFPERKDSEWGLAPWTPYPVVNATAGELSGARLRLLSPGDYPLGLEIPMVAWIENTNGQAVRANALLQAEGYPSIQLRRGAGSGYLGSTHPAGPLVYTARLPGLNTNKIINLETNTVWSPVGGILNGTNSWPPNSRVAITNHLTLRPGSSLTIGEGSVVRLDPGVNITNNGSWVIQGTPEKPVVFTPQSRSRPWGGFFMRTSTSSLQAHSTVFVASGADPKAGAGHRSEQCLFFLDQRPRLALTNCAAIDLAGQFGHSSSGVTNSSDPFWTEVILDHTLVQRCVTGGEWKGCRFKLLNSAVLEAPYATPVFADDDEDGLYFIQGETEVRDSVIGWTRDDGIDSGSGDGGSITVSNTWVESTFHEAFAWSGGGGTPGPRRATNDHCVVLNCGQAFECGWSSGGVAYSPFVSVQDSLAIGNGIGARFGDNYDWSYYGFLQITNSILVNNRRDVWGYNWQTDTNGWIYRAANMSVESNYLSQLNPYHPANQVWNPAIDAGRLASFLTTPPGAPAGIAFVTWTNQLDMDSLFEGVPVGLSCFSTNQVSVDYSFQDQAGALSTGTLSFAPGETVKRISPAGFSLAGKTWIQVVLSNPIHGELTGAATVVFQGSAPSPEVSLWTKEVQTDLARVSEGVPITLTAPSTQPIRITGQWEASGQIMAPFTVDFLPGQTLQWIAPPEVALSNQSLLRLALDQSLEAPLRGPSQLYFVKSTASASPPEWPIITPGAPWKYLDSATNAVPGWFAVEFNDASWKEGAAPLGYGNTPRETTTVSYGSDSSRKQITTYFRHYFHLTNALELTSLRFNLLRDDGAVLYLNGSELYRENMPTGIISYGSTAVTNVGGTATVYTSNPLAANSLPAPLRNGTNLVAVEIHQNSGSSSDILFDLEVTGYSASAAGSQPSLNWGLFDRTNLVVAWSDSSYVLEQAPALYGPYTNIVQRSPVIFNLTNNQSFFRLRK